MHYFIRHASLAEVMRLASMFLFRIMVSWNNDISDAFCLRLTSHAGIGLRAGGSAPCGPAFKLSCQDSLCGPPERDDADSNVRKGSRLAIVGRNKIEPFRYSNSVLR
jgi:hypothetical protein